MYVWFSEDDRMILHINSINSPCWISGTVYFEDGSYSFSYITDVSFFTADLLNGRVLEFRESRLISELSVTSGDTLFKTDLKDIVHIKNVRYKITKRYRYLSYNYR